MHVPRFLVRLAMTGLQLVRRAAWLVGGGRREGVHAVALTPAGQVVLVRLTYARGWRLPGGGRGRGEDRRSAVLRELREEIGLVEHGAVAPAQGSAGRRGYFIVRDVLFEPRRNFEVEEVRAFAPEDLPRDVTSLDRWVIGEALAK